MQIQVLNYRDIEVVLLGLPKTKGTTKQYGEKFLLERAGYKSIVDQIIYDFDQLPNGSIDNQGFERLKINSIVIDRYFADVEWEVLFPPMPGQEQPLSGSYKSLIWTSSGIYDTGAINVLLTKQNELVVIERYRHVLGGFNFEFLRGIKKVGEKIEDCAKRQITTMLDLVIPKSSELVELGWHNADTGILSQQARIYGCKSVEVLNREPKRTEQTISQLYVYRIKPEDFEYLIALGYIICGQTLSAWSIARAKEFINF